MIVDLMVAIIVFVLILGLLVLIHEFGHFIAAKKNGVKVEEFGFGFPPRLFGIKRGETLYSINLIPLGGFVKVFGEEYHELENEDKETMALIKKEKERAFVFKKPHQKAIILVAGVLMNLLLGVTIYYVLLSINHFQSEPITLIGNYKFRFGEQEKRVIIARTVPGSVAEKAGAEFGDQIMQVKSGQSILEPVTDTKRLITFINASKDKPVTFDVLNVTNNVHKEIIITPKFNPELKRAVVGINLAEAVVVSYNRPQEKILSGFMHSYNVLAYNFAALKTIFGYSVQEKSLAPVSGAVSGPLGIFDIIKETLKSSGGKIIINLANIVALLSLSLGFMNILPLPALDGGRLVFVAYEWITKKRANVQVERLVNMIGFLALLGLMVLITFSDIVKLIK